MMKFDCPHCGQQLVHQEEVAGREGWCRFCKGIIVMPQPGGPCTIPNLSPEQRFAQLTRMFRFAAGVVDEHRQLQAGLRNGEQALAHEIQLRTEAQRMVETLQHELTRTRAARTELDVAYKRLNGQLTESKSEHAAFLTETEKRLVRANNEIQANESRDGVLLERVLAIEQDIDRAEEIAKQAFDELSRERDAFERTLSGVRTELSEARAAESALKASIEEAEAREKALLDEMAASKRSYEESREQLEEECKRLTTLYNGELEHRSESAGETAEARLAVERVAALEAELAAMREAMDVAATQHNEAQEHSDQLRTELSEARESEATLKTSIEEAEAREKALLDELAESKRSYEESREQLEEECKRLTTLYNTELEKREESGGETEETRLASERVSALEDELAAIREEMDIADAQHKEAEASWELLRAELCDQVEHYRDVLQKVEEDLAAIESMRASNESRLQSQIDEKRVELLREGMRRDKSERALQSLQRELDASKIALAAAEENLRELRDSTESLKSEIGTAFRAKVV